MNALVLDLETYYDQVFTLRKMTIAEYVGDARFWVHGIAVRHPDGRAEFHTDVPSALRQLQALYGERFERVTVIFHNSYFDAFVLAKRFDIHPLWFTDTMLLSYAVHGRKCGRSGALASLDHLTHRYGLGEKGDLAFMLGVRNPDAKQVAALTEYARNDVQLTHSLALKLLPLLTNPQMEFHAITHTVRLFTERGVTADKDGIAQLKAEVIAETERFLTELRDQIASGRIDIPAEVGSRDMTLDAMRDLVSRSKFFVPVLKEALARTGRQIALKPGKKGLIPAVAKKDEAMQALLDDDDPVVASLAHARLGKKSEDQLLAKLETLERIAGATGGYLPTYMVYCGAHTGRFAGGQKFNLQNLGRDGFGAKMRKLLCAAEGHTLIIGDMAQIEARVLAWLASETDLLQAFATGADLYSAFASDTVFHCPVRKTSRTDAEHAFMAPRRQVGKTSILGLGYSMGALRFMNTLRADPLTAALFDDGTLSASLCRDIVTSYRERYARISFLWKTLECAFRRAMDGHVLTIGPLSFLRSEEAVMVRLPSGRELRYYRPRLEPASRAIQFLNELGEQDEFTPEGDVIAYTDGVSLYGGKLTENIVQAIARDLLVHAMLILEARGFPVAFHVHDEVVLQVPDVRADEAFIALKKALEGILSPLTWAQGLPMAAEVHTSKRYEK